MSAVLALAAAALTGAAVAEERRYAIVVGNNRGDPTDLPLYYAERDASRMADVLTSLGAVRQEDLVLLKGADRKRVLEVVDEMGRRAAGDDELSLVIVYYSGHADSRSLHLDGTQLGFDELTEALADLPAELRVLVVDACRSGGLTRVKGASPVEPFQIQAQDKLETHGTAIITSSSSGEDAQESDRLRGGVFTHHFVAGLLGAADASGDAKVTLTEAYRYGYAQTLRTTSAQAIVQHPTYSFELRGKDDIVLTEVGESRRSALLILEDAGDYLLFDARRGGELLTEVTVPAGARISVPAGQYLLRRRTERQVQQLVLRLSEGREVGIRASQLATVPYGQTVRKGYSDERRSAVGLLVGTGVGGPPLPALGVGLMATAGARFDFEPLSLVVRGRYVNHVAENHELYMWHDVAGLDLTAMKLVDLGRVAPGIGVRIGTDGVWQSFDTIGEAPPRAALQLRGGSVLRTEFAPAARWVLGAEFSVDVLLYPGQSAEGDPRVTTSVVPVGSLDLTRWF